MPSPYDDVDDVGELGLAAYLRIVAADDKSGYAGALFVINARGEPIEFTYNRIETHHSFQVDFLGVQKLQSLLGVNLGNSGPIGQSYLPLYFAELVTSCNTN